eukprot:Lithocolla_globosa_v1_NODE_5763_length_1188_cov_95.780229.p2 type:complete len:105 gc:universal NODE_5763_length_1188_cov_95.780229:781-467(-)
MALASSTALLPSASASELIKVIFLVIWVVKIADSCWITIKSCVNFCFRLSCFWIAVKRNWSATWAGRVKSNRQNLNSCTSAPTLSRSSRNASSKAIWTMSLLLT